MIFRGLALWLACTAVTAATVSAQGALTTDTCALYDQYVPNEGPAAKQRIELDVLKKCIAGLKAEIAPEALAKLAPAKTDAAKNMDDAKAAEAKIHDRLALAYFAYRNLREWYATRQNDDRDGTLTKAWNELRAALEQQLAEHDIRRRFAAELMTGFSFTALGAQTAAVGVSPEAVSQLDSQSSQPTGYVTWETLHLGSYSQRGGRPDFSVGGIFGFRPTLTLVDIADPADQQKTIGPVVAFQQAFVWNAGVDLHWRIGEATEHGPFVRYGQTLLTSIDTLIDNKGQTAIGKPANNVTGRAEGVGGFGYRFDLFQDPLDRVHLDRSVLSPTFAAGLGLRYDSRFKGQGVLGSFSDPEWRLVYTVGVNALRVLSSSAAATSPVSLTIQVDYERAMKQPTGPYVPSATRVFVQGSTDVIKAFKGGQ